MFFSHNFLSAGVFSTLLPVHETVIPVLGWVGTTQCLVFIVADVVFRSKTPHPRPRSENRSQTSTAEISWSGRFKAFPPQFFEVVDLLIYQPSPSFLIPRIHLNPSHPITNEHYFPPCTKSKDMMHPYIFLTGPFHRGIKEKKKKKKKKETTNLINPQLLFLAPHLIRLLQLRLYVQQAGFALRGPYQIRYLFSSWVRC